ncbi:fumarylacetoacetate hydrolase family protein [Thiohalorhabdus sp. Cl-TMA]|uniref:Fumarylacetoacetate hydrolase family protein n=1 Tax=Thiohalorhabdus methylotrophus TaxID=3242694 RepID=A0ABV4TUA7_9GAMM
MRLISFSDQGRTRIGVLRPEAGRVLDLQAVEPRLPWDMATFIAGGEASRMAADEAAGQASPEAWRALEELTVLPPLPIPARDILCVGKNYRAHVDELSGSGLGKPGTASDVPEYPVFFTKAATTVSGPEEPIPAYLDYTESVDYEGELAVIIGKEGRGIPAEEAFDHVFGYTIVNDVTSRRLQRRHGQWFLGKSVDGFCPMGPALVTADEIDDLDAVRITTRVNGEQRQSGCLADLIFGIPELIETLSRTMTLMPGDVIATGTPEGVGAGFDPPRFLRSGDRVEIHVSGIGTLGSPVE